MFDLTGARCLDLYAEATHLSEALSRSSGRHLRRKRCDDCGNPGSDLIELESDEGNVVNQNAADFLLPTTRAIRFSRSTLCLSRTAGCCRSSISGTWRGLSFISSPPAMTYYCRKAGQYIGRRRQATFTTAWLIYAMRHRYDGAFRAASQTTKELSHVYRALPRHVQPDPQWSRRSSRTRCRPVRQRHAGITRAPKIAGVLGLRWAPEVLSHIDSVEVKDLTP